jgi:nucleotide-binding universal stress UspA family protein
MKNVLLLVHDDAGQEARLQAALDLTRALSGHLACVGAMELPAVVDTFGGGSVAILIADEQARLDANRMKTESRIAAEGVSWTWTEATGNLATCVLDAAKTSDLVVLNGRLDDAVAVDMRHVATEVLTHGRALVLAVPDSSRGFNASGKALVAWDGSERAMSTVQRAVPLLSLAEDVKIFQVGELGRATIPAEDAAAYLSRHGIEPEIEITPKAESIAVAIRLEADRIGASYVLMGAYKHRPAREALFGGVTRAMLGACSVPLVLGH